jgi:ClpX C4-type zinc finger
VGENASGTPSPSRPTERLQLPINTRNLTDDSCRVDAVEKVAGMSVKITALEETPRCSFCHKSQVEVAHLIASPPSFPRAYICDECVEVIHSILKEGLNQTSMKAGEEH